MQVLIRNEEQQDIDAIDAVIVSAFLGAAHTDHTEQFIVKALRAAGQLTLSLVAEIHGDVAGHVAVSPVVISNGPSSWFGLGPVSVVPEHQGQGLGTLLVQAALSGLRTSRASGCVVLGDPAFYSRFGFKVEPSLVLPGVPAGYFQALSFGGKLPVGTVTYHPSFAAQG